MLPILGAILGFAGSVLPELLKLYKDGKDKKHEIELLKLQMEAQKQLHTERLEEISAQADIEEAKALYTYAKEPEVKPTGVKAIDAIVGLLMGLVSFLISSVRPAVTYWMVGIYAYVKTSQMRDIGAHAWTDYDFTLFSTIVAFWFGSRNMQRWLKR
ncbi:MAG: hypothetical protein ACUVUQ_04990 [Thermodesulfovibrionales bacterium]